MCTGPDGLSRLELCHIIRSVNIDLTDNSDATELTAGRAEITVTPFLKWPGGKRWFVAGHAHLLPQTRGTYIEPFLGGASVFFHLKPRRALLGDKNSELIAVYEGIRTDWRAIDAILRKHQEKHSKRHYYKVRQDRPICALERAARLLYLNRTCFNGIYRVNRLGEFNVPKGTKRSVLLDSDNFAKVARMLQGAELHATDFEVLIDRAGDGDLVFADPPYTVRHNLNGFIKYNETLFSWADQERLVKALARARGRGAAIVATNAYHESVCELYEAHGFRLSVVSRFSSISASANSRRQFDELVVQS